MDFAVETSDDLVICRPVGDLDAASAPSLRDTLTHLVDRSPGATLVVDLDRMRLADPVGLEALLDGVHRVTAGGAGLAIVCNDPRLLPVLRNTGLEHLVPVTASVFEARQALASRTVP